MQLTKKYIIMYFVLSIFLLFPYSTYADESTSSNDYGHIQQEHEQSYFQKAKKWWNKNKPGQNLELNELRLELEAKENLLIKIETDLKDIVNNARPRCENGSVTVSVEDGPLIELRNEIAALKSKIAKLE